MPKTDSIEQKTILERILTLSDLNSDDKLVLLKIYHRTRIKENWAIVDLQEVIQKDSITLNQILYNLCKKEYLDENFDFIYGRF